MKTAKNMNSDDENLNPKLYTSRTQLCTFPRV